MKLGNQYGCGEQLNCRMFITLFSYFNTAACGHRSFYDCRPMWSHQQSYKRTILRIYATVKLISIATALVVSRRRKTDFYLVVVHVEIVGRAEDGDKRWEARRLRFSVHTISSVLSLVRPYDAEQIVVLQKVATRRVTASRHCRSIV